MQSRFVYAVLGAGAGAAVAWAVTADIYDNKAKKERDAYAQLLADKTEHIWALQDRLDNPQIEDVDTIQGQLLITTPIEEVNEETTEEVDEVDEETEEETRSNLQGLIDQYTADEDAQEEFRRQATASEGGNNPPPKVISQADYAFDDEGQYFDKVTLNYYFHEKVLLDDEEEPFNNVVGDIGWRNLSRFGDQSEDPNVVFIRNYRLETDFEVVKIEDEQIPLHVKYGMDKEEFRVNKAAGTLKLRPEDE